MSKEEYAKFHGNFMKLMYNFDDVYQYTVHIDCEGVVMQFSSAIIEFYLFYDRPVDMQIRAPLTRSQTSVESVTQVIVKTHGPLDSFERKSV